VRETKAVALFVQYTEGVASSDTLGIFNEAEDIVFRIFVSLYPQKYSMAKKRKQLPLLENILITNVAAEGKAIAKVDGMTVFVPFVVPGDVVDIQLTRKKSNYAEGKAVRFESFSEKREEAFCEHFGICGGCKWQILPYEEQLKYKQKQVTDNLQRIGKIELPEISSILGAPETIFYRNKLEFTFSDKRWLTEKEISSDKEFLQMNALGFHIPGMFDKVLDIHKCWLQNDLSNQIRNTIREFCLQSNYSFFDLRNQSGLMRTLIVRNTSVGEWMVIVVFFEDDTEKREKLLNHITDKFPQITSLLYIINQKANDTITDQEVIVWKGRDYIVEEMEGLQFKIGPKSFYQTNSRQAYNLYKIAREFAGLSGNELVYDLYTGTGTIANFIARDAKKVIGIEFVEEAIEDAKENSRINNIENTLFLAGDMRKILTQDFINEHGRPNVIITDPPRAGMHDDVIETILFAEPQRIVYVSCNPATQARDLNLLGSKYRVMRVQPVDMFPHTHHVENVLLLMRK
jgi:23S rRNA (uracil1939-C5)-methyltransferase